MVRRLHNEMEVWVLVVALSLSFYVTGCTELLAVRLTSEAGLPLLTADFLRVECHPCHRCEFLCKYTRGGKLARSSLR